MASRIQSGVKRENGWLLAALGFFIPRLSLMPVASLHFSCVFNGDTRTVELYRHGTVGIGAQHLRAFSEVTLEHFGSRVTLRVAIAHGKNDGLCTYCRHEIRR